MTNVSYLLVFVALVTLAATAPPTSTSPKCADLAKIPTNATEALQPFGKEWRLFKSLRPIERCVRFQYTVDPTDPTKAVGSLTSKLLGEFTANITVNAGNEWNVYNNFDGRTAKFYTLNYNPKLNFWCVYTCEDNEKFIEDIRCFALDNNGNLALEADLATMTNLPIKRSEVLFNVYDNKCDSV